MSTEVRARPVNWCPVDDRRRRQRRQAFLAFLVGGWLLWSLSGGVL